VTTVISLGGSIVAPDGPDSAFIMAFVRLVREYLAVDETRRAILVVGGGGAARQWQKAYRECMVGTEACSDEAQDWIGVMATRLNAQLVKAVFGELCPQDVVIDPSTVSLFMGRVLVAAGWKPGFSTDFDAVLLAQKFGAGTVLNLSNIATVFSGDPKLDPQAAPIEKIGWNGFRKLVGEVWSPGKNLPFDPVASRQAAESGLRVICAAGRDLDNVRNILEDKPYAGTTIGPLP